MSHSNKLTLYYWPLLGRSAGIFRMLQEAKADYTHVSDKKEMAKVCAAFGASKGANFAPPVLVDGEVKLSQSIAIMIYLGSKFGFNDEIKGADTYRAMQLHNDLADIASQATSTKEPGEWASNRLMKWLAMLQRAVKDDFFFAAKPSSVDFHFEGLWSMAEFLFLDKAGVEPLKNFPKLDKIVKAIRALDSYKKFDKLPIYRN